MIAHDPRWPVIRSALSGLREQRRFSVRIVDADCGAGALLIRAVRHARMLGFTAIEGRGISGSPAMIGRARCAARRASDPAIGLEFASLTLDEALRAERDLPADILLWRGPITAAVSQAAILVIAQDDRTWLEKAA
ncbi:hypothetical protein QE363_002568 [Sphingomonas sp. SORGH_AS870]|uniref:SAM-dependent methyltransferase n=1 Tax=Sphingomonas sp. SORGH_AS_0870 TaxID=3041801 RepID=UPI002862540C|nr:SAM-dependent methyltransferase [Sphingomonas sp. SORGH_AS_0870]MDR6146775.1 hypothetical protein [Sphingomonas sp. SORGH_AS_0870]